jgi:hypothetical protein
LVAGHINVLDGNAGTIPGSGQSGIDRCEVYARQHGYDAESPDSISTVLDSTKALHKRRERPEGS